MPLHEVNQDNMYKKDTFYYFKTGDEDFLMRGKILSELTNGKGYVVEREKNGKFEDFSDAMTFSELLEKGTPIKMA